MKKIMFNDKYGLTAAVLEGRKTQTRRFANLSKHEFELLTGVHPRAPKELIQGILKSRLKYNIGEIVAVAQSYRDICAECFEPDAYVVRTSQLYGLAGWSNKMFTSSDEMPHQIRITGVRVERLQDISDEDCMKEGVHYIDDLGAYYFERKDREEGFYFGTPREAYAALIDKVSGRGTWDRNPWVLVYEFELEQ